MTLDEAIKELANAGDSHAFTIAPRFYKACQIGAEAIKRLKHDREVMQAKHVLLLPGETEE